MSNTTLKLLPPLTVSTNNNGSSDTYITTQSETLSLPPQPFSTAGKFGAYTFNSQGLLTGYDPAQVVGPSGVTPGTYAGDRVGSVTVNTNGFVTNVASTTPYDVNIWAIVTVPTSTNYFQLSSTTPAWTRNAIPGTSGLWTGTNLYTAQVAGRYRVGMNISFPATTTGTNSCFIQVTTSETTLQVGGGPKATTGTVGFSYISAYADEIPLLVGETVKFYASQSSGVSVDVAANMMVKYVGP
jgi:hypothetical protein